MSKSVSPVPRDTLASSKSSSPPSIKPPEVKKKKKKKKVHCRIHMVHVIEPFVYIKDIT